MAVVRRLGHVVVAGAVLLGSAVASFETPAAAKKLEEEHKWSTPTAAETAAETPSVEQEEAGALAAAQAQAAAPPALATLAATAGAAQPTKIFHNLQPEVQNPLAGGGTTEGEENGEGEWEETEEEHKKNEEHVHISAVRSTSAILLLGFVGFIMSKFYLVNWPQQEIRKTTWQVTSNSISIFCAVLIFQAFSRVMKHLEKHLSGHGMHTAYFICMLAWWGVIELCMYVKMKKALHLAAIGTLGAHIIGFSALYAFGGLATSDELFGTGWVSMIATVVLYILMITGLGVAGKLMREKVNSSDGEVDEYEERWAEQCIDTENDFMCMGGSFLASMVIRMAIVGEMPPMAEGFEGKTSTEIWTLLVVAFVFLLAVAPATHFVHHTMSNVTRGYGLMRFAKNLQGTIAFTAAWCLYFWAQWIFYHHIENRPMLACMVTAFGMSVFGVLSVFFLDCLNQKGYGEHDALDALVTAIGLLVGLCWEQTFDMAVETIVEMHEEQGLVAQDMVQFGVSSWLVLIVLPAWMVYILPKSDEELQKLVPPMTPVCIICREVEYDEDLLSSDEEELEEGTEHMIEKAEALADLKRPKRQGV